MSKLEVDAIEPQSGTTLTIGASGDSVNMASGAKLKVVGTGVNGIELGQQSDGTDSSRLFFTNNTNVCAIRSSGGSIKFSTGATIGSSSGDDRVTIDSSGNLQFDSGYGSVATAYGVRAWVNFNGTGTLAIRDSGGVSSVTDVGTGAYQANFSNNMPDVNFTGLTNAGPVISTGAKQFNFCSCNKPDAVGSVYITNREVDVDDNGFASADNAYVGLIVIR